MPGRSFQSSRPDSGYVVVKSMNRLLLCLILVQLASLTGAAVWLCLKRVTAARLGADLIIILCLPLIGLACVWQLEKNGAKYAARENQAEYGVIGGFQTNEWKLTITQLPPLDYFHETNIVPAADILLHSNYESRRRYMLDLLKNSDEDLQEISRVRTALENDDLETAHYAASGMQHICQHLENKLAQAAAAFARDPGNSRLLYSYTDCIDQYLQIIRPSGQRAFQLEHQLIRLLLRQLRSGSLNRADRLVELLQETGHIRQAEAISSILLHKAAESEEKYLALLKFYFSVRNWTEFDLTLNTLRASHLIISDETLNMIRIWTGALK